MPLRLLLTLLFLCVSCAAQADEVLRIAADRWPPYADRQLPGNGVAVHLVQAALKRAGYASEYIEVPWPRVLHGGHHRAAALFTSGNGDALPVFGAFFGTVAS